MNKTEENKMKRKVRDKRNWRMAVKQQKTQILYEMKNTCINDKRKQRLKMKMMTVMNKIHNHQKLIHQSLAPNLKRKLKTLVTSVLRTFARLLVLSVTSFTARVITQGNTSAHTVTRVSHV